MGINTKLLLLLTLAVGAVMLAASFLNLRQREVALEAALRDELRAHAVTLQIAIEENYRSGRTVDAGNLIHRLRENSRVYGILLFDEKGNLRSLSQETTAAEFRQPPELAHVLKTGETVEFVRVVENEKFLSMILPLELNAEISGAVEIVKPLSLIESDISRARLNWLLTTLLLIAAIFLVVYFVLRQSLSRPVQTLLVGAKTIGGGDLAHRVAISNSGDEIAQLAAEFNRMADNLELQRRATLIEAENRLQIEKELRHSERLAAVGKLAAGIAHELGAPLNVIDVRAEQLIENGEPAREKQINNLSIIRAQSARITHIVRQLLNLARPYNLRFETAAINDLINSALEGTEISDEIKIEFAGNNLWVKADAEFIKQVFVNIFRNAAQAMKGGGTLKIETREIEIDAKKCVAVEISDTGAGISPEIVEKIFDPFYTTAEIGEGTGLGLAVSRRIVEEHGGQIEAANLESGGACFTVYLPQSAV